jgi:putative redox protein
MESANAIAVISRSHYTTTVTTPGHTFTADEPKGVGGADEGPAPGDLLRASLATCTAITLRMYADRKKYDVDQIEVHVRTEKAPDNKTIFHREIIIRGALTEDERTRLLQIAEKCPTHKVLVNPIEIISTFRVV